MKVGFAHDGVAAIDALSFVAVVNIATERGTPARSRFLTAVLLRSWNKRPGTPAASHAAFHAPLKYSLDLKQVVKLRENLETGLRVRELIAFKLR